MKKKLNNCKQLGKYLRRKLRKEYEVSCNKATEKQFITVTIKDRDQLYGRKIPGTDLIFMKIQYFKWCFLNQWRKGRLFKNCC